MNQNIIYVNFMPELAHEIRTMAHLCGPTEALKKLLALFPYPLASAYLKRATKARE